jgi:ABC-type branched-subunit amino acid transport system permease subunit
MGRLKSFFFVLPVLLLAAIGPSVFEMFGLVQISSFAAMALAVLGLAFVWGTLGVLSLGHAAFFGLGAYAYAITVINLGESSLAVAAAIAVPALFSVVLGYFVFFGRVSDVYLGVITLCVTLVLYNFTSATADPSYHIGDAPLGGFNGITAVPPLNWPGDPSAMLEVEAMFRLCLIVLAAVYAALVALRHSSTGRIMVAVRESELRSELLGYDVRLYKMLGFTVSAAVAGLGGALYTAVNGYVGPSAFDLNQASQFLLWVIAGGLGSLAGPVIASFAFQYLSTYLGTTGVNTDLVFGAIIMLFVLLKLRDRIPALWNRVLGFRRPPQKPQAFTPVARALESGE